MVYWHILIGIGEAVISALIVFYIYKVKPEIITTESILMRKIIVLNIKSYKRPVISIAIVTGILMLMIAVGFSIGILSDAPDGLERVLIDQKGETWLESLESPWVPLFSWIKSDYGAGILGIALSVVLMSSAFYLVIQIKKKNQLKLAAREI
jgi:hypothetical protein